LISMLAASCMAGVRLTYPYNAISTGYKCDTVEHTRYPDLTIPSSSVFTYNFTLNPTYMKSIWGTYV